jgi:hypothetical protein
MIRDNRNFAYDLRDVCDSREAPGQQLIAQVSMNRRKIIFFSSAGTRLCDFTARTISTFHRFQELLARFRSAALQFSTSPAEFLR